MKTFATYLLILAIGFGGVAPAPAWAAGFGHSLWIYRRKEITGTSRMPMKMPRGLCSWI